MTIIEIISYLILAIVLITTIYVSEKDIRGK